MDQIDRVKACITAMRTGIASGDWAELWDHVDPAFEIIEAASLPYGGTHRGADGIAALLKSMGETWEIQVPDPEYFAAPPRVFKCNQFRARARASGIEVDMPLIEVFTMSQDRVTRLEVFYFDTAAICAAVAG